jgi:transglutaminase-like putative cysteine protease
MRNSRGDILILLTLVLSNLFELTPVFFGVFSLLILVFNFANERVWDILKKLTAILSFPAFAFLYGAIKQVEPAICTIGILSLLKYTEIRNIRDRLSYYTLLLVFISGSVLLSNQIFYLVIAISCLFYIFIRLGNISGIKFNLKRLIKILIPSLAFSSFIFFLVPQVKVGNIFKYIGDRNAQSGFSTSINPGDYNKIVKDDNLYFFASYNRLPKDGYWRGITYNYTDGRKWVQRNIKPKRQVLSSFKDPDLVVRVINNTKTPLFYLDNTQLTGVDKNINVYVNKYNDTLSRVGITRVYGLNIQDKEIERVAPDKYSLYYPKKNISTQLSKFLSNIKGDKAETKVRGLLKEFRKLNLRYSLETELDEGSDLSRFLFDYKRGYCIHFASSFALALRVLGVPANVVGGFYGGEVNRTDKFILVKGGNAHAWIEYWNGEKWIDFDPVGEIVPAADLPRNDIAAVTGLDAQGNQLNRGFIASIFESVESAYLYANLKFFEFDLEKQVALFVSLKERLKNKGQRIFKQVIIGLFGISFLGVITLLVSRAYFVLRKDSLYIEKILKILNLQSFHGIEKLSNKLVQENVNREKVNRFRELFTIANYTSKEIDKTEYIALKRELLRDIKNRNRNL